jgi:hypothetical protein
LQNITFGPSLNRKTNQELEIMIWKVGLNGQLRPEGYAAWVRTALCSVWCHEIRLDSLFSTATGKSWPVKMTIKFLSFLIVIK